MNSCIKSFLGLFVLWNMLGFSRVYAVTDLSGPGTLSKAGESPASVPATIVLIFSADPRALRPE